MVEHIANIRSGVSGWKSIIRTEIILGSSTRNRREFDIAVNIELDFTLAGPPTRQLRPRQESPNVPALALHAVKNGIRGVVAFDPGPPPLGVEVACFPRNGAN